MLKLSSITKALTEAINAAPDVDSLSKTLGPCSVDPRIVQEYGTTHSATCVAYDPVQRLLAVGVDTGVKVLGADGLSVLLATRHHLEPAKIVRFARSVGRVVRVSVESGICVWDLKSQTLLASTRWQSEVTAIVGLRRSNFLMVGDADGVSAIATVRPGSPLGALVPHAYAVDTDQAIGVRAWERGVSSSSDDATHMHDSSCSGNPTAVGTSKSPVVAIEPQPGFETARVLLAFANNRLTLWDLHAKKCAAVNVAMNGSAGTEIGELRCATWVGLGGGVLATGHDAGVVCVWQVPAIGKPGSLRRNAAQITLSNVFHPQPGDNLHERMPVRGVVARAFGTAGGAMAGGVSGAHHKRSASGVQNESKGTAEENPAIGVLACVGGEEPGALDFAVLVPMAGDSNGKQEGPRGPSLPCAPRTSQAATLPYYGPVTSLALASPPFREETTAAIFTLSEGGQIHVHDARLVGGANYPVDAAHAPVPDDTRGVENSAYSVSAEVSTSDVTAVGSARNPLPVEEIGQAMPRLAARCAPAGTAASPGLLKSFATEIANAANARRALHETWGDAWPLTGGAPDDAGRWFKGSAAPRNVLAAAAADGGGVHVCVEGVGRFVPVALASPGPNAGMSPRDRAMTQCHLACGGAMLIIGRACGAVEVHVARALAAAGAGPENDRVTIRMLDGGLDLKQPVLDTTSRNSTAGYRLVGELGVHSSRVTCIETFIANDRSFLCVGDASGVVSVSDLKQGVLRFAASPFAGGAGDTEGVAAAAFCAPVVGTVSFELENEGVGSLDRSLSGSDARIENDCENKTPSPQTQNAFHGAEMLTLVSTGSALAFVSVASGEVLGKPCRPKTPSVALAVAPLDAFGASIRSARRGDRGTLRRLDHGLAPGSNWFWFTQDDPRSESAAGDTKHDHPTPPSHESLTALVAVASREALRVYPANGAIRGERHTLKKATASEPLIGAALVTPRGAEDTGTGDGDEGGAMTHRHASAFAAVTAHGRVLVWALPGLALLASVGPLPALSSADATCFGLDGGGSFFAFGGGGTAVAKLALALPSRGPKARPESGVMFWDEDIATAADAADEAAEIAAFDASAEKQPKHASTFPHCVVSDDATNGVEKHATPSNPKLTPSKDFAAASRNLFKGDTRSAMASFGSAMRGAKEKAKSAAETIKDKAKTAVDAVKFAVEEEDSPRATAADLAMLFADCESVRRPATLGTVVTGGSDTRTEASRPRKTVSQKLGFTGLKSFAGKTKTNKEKVEQVPESTADASGRAELFRVGSGGESGASGSSGAPRMSSADEIRAKYGKSKPTDNGAGGAGKALAGDLHETRDKLAERGEKLASLQDKTLAMQSDAEDFHTMAQKLAKQQKSWW